MSHFSCWSIWYPMPLITLNFLSIIPQIELYKLINQFLWKKKNKNHLALSTWSLPNCKIRTARVVWSYLLKIVPLVVFFSLHISWLNYDMFQHMLSPALLFDRTCITYATSWGLTTARLSVCSSACSGSRAASGCLILGYSWLCCWK